jgi:hypothetical protein
MYQRVMDLVSSKRPNIRAFDQDGHTVDLKKLHRLADEETAKATSKAQR